MEWRMAMDRRCEKYSVSLSAFFDGELAGSALKELEVHLAGCTRCSGDLKKFRKIRETLRSRPGGVGPARSVLQSLREKLGKDNAQ